MTRFLDTLKDPKEIHAYSDEDLLQLAEEIREKIVDSISQTGGHFSSNLGTVELSVALHRVFSSPDDKIIWDVGHQAYPHKLLTGRADRFHTIRQTDGLSGFLSIYESEHDIFGAGHAGTACSAAVGLRLALDALGKDDHVIAVVGDGAMTAGMAFEALNHAGHMQKNLIVILNDNLWSISKNVGAMSDYLNRIITGQYYNVAKENLEKLIHSIPSVGTSAVKWLHSAEEHLKGMIVPGTWFEELGFRYFGPVDGHDLLTLVDTLTKVKQLKGPILLHTVTTKGKGYAPAEEDAMKWHGPTPFDKVEGKFHQKSELKTYTQIAVEALIEEARKDDRVYAITAAMASGTGLQKFGELFPDRLIDVGIAEQHAVTLAAGMARGGVKPVAAIYSTFLQRGFDQIVHDVAIQNLPVVFAVDRAGLVGADGHTHQGMFDISYLRQIPNMAIFSASNEAELVGMFKTAMNHPGPIAVRYPRTDITARYDDYLSAEPVPLGQCEVLREGEGVALIAIGPMVEVATQAAEILAAEGYHPWVINMRTIKPMDRAILRTLSAEGVELVTLEEHTLPGGFGSAVLEAWEEEQFPPVRALRIGIHDHFVEHGSRKDILRRLGLDVESVTATIRKFIENRPSCVEPVPSDSKTTFKPHP
jgi:1-deoxy-D-xylulose-5-phosphate synthase